MNDSFEQKVRAAAVAGWWVVLFAYVLLTAVWSVYLILVSARPAWLLAMWGQAMSVGACCKQCRCGSWDCSSCLPGF